MRKKAVVTSATVRTSASGSGSKRQSASASVAGAGEPQGDQCGFLVVVELGAEWPSLVGAGGEGTARRVVVQLEGETPAGFAERLANSLDGLFGRGVKLQSVALACNERLDPAAEAARRKLLGLALGSMAKHKSGCAFLAASPRSGGRLRHALSALAQGLFDEWRTAGLEVSVDFGQESRAGETTPLAFTSRVA